ncbi:MAG: DUF2029 domain-containing protein [Bdellovibrionales bacterium]|nr:DUF2029 domain-containing protein [Bdellovibrionales bacterium]
MKLSLAPSVANCLRPLLLVLVVLVLLGLAAFGAPQLAERIGYRIGSPGTTDFLQYWTAGRLALSGANPFDALAVSRVQQGVGLDGSIILMRSPPWTLLWVAPLLLLPFEGAALMWLGLNMLMIVATAIVISRLSVYRSPSLLSLGLGTAFFYPLWESLMLGQFSILLMLFIATALFAADRERPFLGGLLLAPLAIKPHLFVLLGVGALVWATTHRRPSIVLGAVCGFGITLAGTAALSPALMGQWFESLFSATRLAGAVPVREWVTATLPGAVRLLLYRTTGSASLWPLWWCPVAGLLLLALTLRWRSLPLSWALFFPPLLCLSVFFAPYGWLFDQAVLLPLQLILLGRLPLMSCVQKVFTVVGLGAVQAAMLLQAVYTDGGQHAYFWTPAAWLAIWLSAERQTNRICT